MAGIFGDSSLQLASFIVIQPLRARGSDGGSKGATFTPAWLAARAFQQDTIIHINDWNFVYDSISDPTSTRISITTYTVTDTYSRCIAEYRCTTTCTLSLCLPRYDLMLWVLCRDTIATNVEQRHCELQTVHHDVLQVCQYHLTQQDSD